MHVSLGSRHGRESSLGGAPTGHAHGVEGVDVENVEDAASIHQHLGEVLLADNGVDDERVAPRSGDMGGMVPLIESDWSFRLAKEGGDGRLGDTCLSVAHFVLALGVDGIGSLKIMRHSLGSGKLSPSLPATPPFFAAASLPFPSFGPPAYRRKRLRSSRSL